MKTDIKKIISVLLAVILAFSVGTTAFAKNSNSNVTSVSSFAEAAKVLSAKDLPKDEEYPTIIIHGIGQAWTYQLDENGNDVLNKDGEPVTGWPVAIDAGILIKNLLLPLIFSVAFQRDIGLTKGAYKAASGMIKTHCLFPVFCDILVARDLRFLLPRFNDLKCPRHFSTNERINFWHSSISSCWPFCLCASYKQVLTAHSTVSTAE